MGILFFHAHAGSRYVVAGNSQSALVGIHTQHANGEGLLRATAIGSGENDYHITSQRADYFALLVNHTGERAGPGQVQLNVCLLVVELSRKLQIAKNISAGHIFAQEVLVIKDRQYCRRIEVHSQGLLIFLVFNGYHVTFLVGKHHGIVILGKDFIQSCCLTGSHINMVINGGYAAYLCHKIIGGIRGNVSAGALQLRQYRGQSICRKYRLLAWLHCASGSHRHDHSDQQQCGQNLLFHYFSSLSSLLTGVYWRNGHLSTSIHVVIILKPF